MFMKLETENKKISQGRMLVFFKKFIFNSILLFN